MRVTQLLCAAGPVDGVTGQGLAFRALFREWGWEGSDFAAVVAPGMPRGAVRPLSQLSRRDEELMVVHYSGFARGLPEALGRGRRSLLISHNITPARYFWDHQPVEAVRCELARKQLTQAAHAAGALAAVSQFNATELVELSGERRVGVLPVLVDRDRLGVPGPEGAPSGPPTVLFVGRLAPHKRQDLIIRAFAQWRQRRPEAQLVLVGTPMTPEYGAALQRLADDLAPGAVQFHAGLDAAALANQYRRAHAFLCLSEHEGFCIPILEAFHFRVPVIARAAGALPEVVGDAGMLVGEEDRLEVVAELLEVIVEDGELRTELQARGLRRLEVYDRHRVAAQLRSELEAVGAS